MPTARTTTEMMIHFLENLLAMMFLPHEWCRLLFGGVRRRLSREQIAPIGAIFHLHPDSVGHEWLTDAQLPTAAKGLVQTDDVRRGVRAQIDELVLLLQER